MHSARKRRPAAQHLALIGILVVLSSTAEARAQGRGNILRIDPRASQTEDAPVLTTVLEIVQLKSATEVIGPCRALDSDAQKDGRAYDCIADAAEKPRAMWDPITFPEDKTFMTIKVEGRDEQMKLVSKQKWADASKDKVSGVGTAWLVLIDSSGSMATRYDEAKNVAKAFVSSKRDGDIFDVMFFNDLGVVYASKWTGDKEKALSFIDDPQTAKPFKVAEGGVREIGKIIKEAAIEGFNELGNLGQTVKAPMHQAMVVLSSGDGGSASTAVAAAASEISGYMTDGRFEKSNKALPKMPVPVISVWFPAKITGAAMGVGKEERFDQSKAFMESLANPQIGGLYTIVRDAGSGRGERIVSAVRARFDAMWLVKWQVSCVAPTVQQTFNLVFDKGLNISGDGSYQDVPVGIDPSAWPLDINMERTVAEAEKILTPGGKVTIFGNFCWEGKKERAELFLLPKNQEVPTTLDGATLEDAKNAKNTLIEQGLKGTVLDAGEESVVFELPDKEKFLAGKGDDPTARLVLHDNSSKRTSAVTKDKIITLRAKPKPPPYLIIGAIAGGGVILILLLVAAFRGGGKRRGGSVDIAPPPRPVVGNPAPAPMGMPTAAPAPLPGPPPPGPPPGPPPPGPSFVQRATLTGAAGIFTVQPGVEMKAGRDGAMCQILLAEPRVSGCHATMKIESGQLYVRDDNSNNGTTLNGQRLPAGVWTPIPNGASLRFGPIEFSIALE